MVPYVPEIFTGVELATVEVITAKVALELPAATRTLGCTWAAGLSLDSATLTPPVGAVPLRVTVPVELLPPGTLVGLKLSDDKTTGLNTTSTQ